MVYLYCGRRIEELTREELLEALREAIHESERAQRAVIDAHAFYRKLRQRVSS